jgi:hypothetical protein
MRIFFARPILPLWSQFITLISYGERQCGQREGDNLTCANLANHESDIRQVAC